MKLVDTTTEPNGNVTKRYMVAPFLFRHIVSNKNGKVVKDYTFWATA